MKIPKNLWYMSMLLCVVGSMQAGDSDSFKRLNSKMNVQAPIVGTPNTSYNNNFGSEISSEGPMISRFPNISGSENDFGSEVVKVANPKLMKKADKALSAAHVASTAACATQCAEPMEAMHFAKIAQEHARQALDVAQEACDAAHSSDMKKKCEKIVALLNSSMAAQSPEVAAQACSLTALLSNSSAVQSCVNVAQSHIGLSKIAATPAQMRAHVNAAIGHVASAVVHAVAEKKHKKQVILP